MVQHQPSSASKGERGRGPSVQAVLVIFVMLFILFLWLNFVFTQQIVSIGREIQEKSAELRRIERQQDAILKQISAASSQKSLAERAKALGYAPEKPVFVPFDQPISGPPADTQGSGWQPAAPGTVGQQGVYPADPLWDILARQFETVQFEPPH